MAGTVVLTDSDHLPNRLAPILLYAFPGDEIRVTGTDQALTEAYLDALALVGPTGEVQPLSDAVCLSSDPTAACYDPSYPTAIPNRFFDATFIVTGP